uniref:Ribonuclease A-domain domain-containing protein n=1 Tax=Electrophorus electricus TaxID=8005 RepID=A0A4W4F4L4_ELEEL
TVLQHSLTLLLVLCVIPYTDAQTEKEFIKKHIRPLLNCNETMKEINGRGNCKYINTFILDEISNVRQVCMGDKFHHNNSQCYQSRKKFNIIECKVLNSSSPSCIYNRVNANKPIKITCDESNKPVHFGC